MKPTTKPIENDPAKKTRARYNRTVTLSPDEESAFGRDLMRLSGPVSSEAVRDQVLCEDAFRILPWLPDRFADLLILDPPYNLTKTFSAGNTFRARSVVAYQDWLEGWLPAMLRLVKPTGSVYLCGDWRSAAALHYAAEKHLVVRNRITWEREKGRGAEANWKNCSEDIFFATVSDTYTFHVDAVKVKRRVLAPYTHASSGAPKDWERTPAGDFRLTHPSNLWTDITVPFWSMPENTDHPTQKPEKLIAKLILASSNRGDLVFDPFLGSGTTAVVARKLGRRFVGVEIEPAYCCLARKRLDAAARDEHIQGYADGVFWERNALTAKAFSPRQCGPGVADGSGAPTLFDDGQETFR